MGFLFWRKKKEDKVSLKSKKANGASVYRPFDVSLLFVVLLLVFVGIVMVFSSSAVLAKENYHDTYYFLKKEIFFVTLGMVGLILGKNIPYRTYWKWIYPLYIATLALLMAALLFGRGGKTGEVHRWIRLGPLSLQPSEMAKLVAVMFTAYALAKKGEKVRQFSKGFLPVILLSGVYILMILAQKDLGGAAIIAILVFLMLFVAGTKPVYLLGAFLASMPVLYFAIFSVAFRRQRILTFLDPWRNPQGAGFQIIQSFVAFKAGGFTGVGLGEGKQKLFYLPEAHTDFIFSVIGEELGMVGVLLVIALFTMVIFRGLLIALKTKEAFGMYLAFGITCLIGLQAFFNMGVVMGILPTKGLALPFISYGGSSLITNLLAVGILLNISTESGKEAD